MASRTQCSIRCLSNANCGYFSYCNDVCHMQRPFYREVLEDYDCDCSSYILLNENIVSGKEWQKVSKMTQTSFERSPIYLYWESLPIKKVEFRLITTGRDYVYIFNGTGTNSVSWYRNDKLIKHPMPSGFQFNFTSNNDITEPYFRIDFGQTSNYGYRVEATAMNGMYKIVYGSQGQESPINELVISVLFK
ncbi:uncharacterized protein LOC118764387 [Octopus sinensis]|uniref:Uncharacterized protein LOC118764387 n=1 Tax=Octopus sinensis TaxID=2607531 RepID=A0A7E6F062_9MOLL|nr:uncharacterized protein LOC118764387 [Octopus sinensis]